MKTRGIAGVRYALSALVVVLVAVPVASAATYSSPSYKIDASVMDSFGGGTSSTSYKMVSSGGESIIGNGASGSYVLGQGYVAQLQNSIQLSVQPTGLVGHWPLDEPSGTLVTDTSANAYNGTTVATPAWGTGKLSGALTLNGSSQYATLADADLATNITIEAWVNPDTTQSATIISKHSSNSDTNGKITLASGVPSFSVTVGGTLYTATAGSALSNSTWSHVTGTFDGSAVKLYVNGTEVDSENASGAIATNNFVWTIGRDANASSGYFDGLIDNVKIFNRALSPSDVDIEYDAQNAGNSSGLNLGAITPGTSNTALFEAVTYTDSTGYSLFVNQDQNLTSGGDTIPAISGSIASPLTWVEGTTKGLGFTLVSTNATAIPGSWSSGAAYAAFPGSATSFYTRTGTQSSKDVLEMRLRVDVDSTQPSGTYVNTATVTGTITP